MAATSEQTQASDAPERNGVYLLTFPRSASNLFQTMMDKQPGYQCSGYKLFDAGFNTFEELERGPWNEWPEDVRTKLTDQFKKCFENLQDEVADAKKNGKQVFTKEHCIFLTSPEQIVATVTPTDKVKPLQLKLRDSPESPHTNPSSVPDRFLLSMQPIFQIRHPALAFPSMLRATHDIMGHPEITSMRHGKTTGLMNLKQSRELYDWYCQHATTMPPKVIDADDIMNDPAAVRQICVETGMDPDAVQYTWETRTIDEPLLGRMLSTITGSTGIIKGLDSTNLDLDKEKAKWKAEFGDEEGEKLARYVDAAMPDYEYLYSKRIHTK